MESDGIETDYDSGTALWRTLDVTVNIKRAWGEISTEQTARFGLGIDGGDDVEVVSQSLLSQSTVVAVLHRPGFYRYDKALHSVGRDGQLLGTVSPAGDLPSLRSRVRGPLPLLVRDRRPVGLPSAGSAGRPRRYQTRSSSPLGRGAGALLHA